MDGNDVWAEWYRAPLVCHVIIIIGIGGRKSVRSIVPTHIPTMWSIHYSSIFELCLSHEERQVQTHQFASFKPSERERERERVRGDFAFRLFSWHLSSKEKVIFELERRRGSSFGPIHFQLRPSLFRRNMRTRTRKISMKIASFCRKENYC